MYFLIVQWCKKNTDLSNLTTLLFHPLAFKSRRYHLQWHLLLLGAVSRCFSSLKKKFQACCQIIMRIWGGLGCMKWLNGSWFCISNEKRKKKHYQTVHFVQMSTTIVMISIILDLFYPNIKTGAMVREAEFKTDVSSQRLLLVCSICHMKLMPLF